jgi:hypothetical protein
MVIESTIKEADYMMENKEELKLTKDHMDKLHKEGHCMCDDKCLVYIEDISGDVEKMTELMKKIQDEDKDCVFISKEQMDMLHKDGKCDCDDNVTLSYDDEMKEGDYMEDGMNENKEMCSECGTGMMVEGMCNECGYSMNMKEEDVDENFVLAADEAKDKGEKEFEYPKGSGKMHPVTIKTDIKNEEKEVTEITVGETKYKVVEESVNKLTEALSETTKKELMKEDMDFFNKMINYNKK